MRKRQRSEDHLTEVRHKILNSAKDLFTHQGYKKTTIRQIVEKSGILTGSIYYLYKNKEDIFQALILSLTKNCIKKIDDIYAEESPEFRYAAVCAVELKAVENDAIVRECYFAGYSSRMIFEQLVIQFTDLAMALFTGTKHACSREDYFHKTLLIKGAMRSCIAEFYFTRPINHQISCNQCIALALYILGFEQSEITHVISRIENLTDEWSRIGNHLRDYPVEK